MRIGLTSSSPICSGWGMLYQGGDLDEGVRQISGPLVIVGMNPESAGQRYVNRTHVIASLFVGILDEEVGVLPDDQLVAFASAVIALLRRGINVLVHCAAGHSRSGYLITAIHMRAREISVDQAIEGVRSIYPEICLNSCFYAHLKKIETRLRRRS